MDLYENKNTGELFFSDEMNYSHEFDGWIHDEDYGKDYYMDDEMADVEVYELIPRPHAVLKKYYLKYCDQNGWDPLDQENLKKYHYLIKEW